jgi:hypothetical protein
LNSLEGVLDVRPFVLDVHDAERDRDALVHAVAREVALEALEVVAAVGHLDRGEAGRLELVDLLLRQQRAVGHERDHDVLRDRVDDVVDVLADHRLAAGHVDVDHAEFARVARELGHRLHGHVRGPLLGLHQVLGVAELAVEIADPGDRQLDAAQRADPRAHLGLRGQDPGRLAGVLDAEFELLVGLPEHGR